VAGQTRKLRKRQKISPKNRTKGGSNQALEGRQTYEDRKAPLKKGKNWRKKGRENAKKTSDDHREITGGKFASKTSVKGIAKGGKTEWDRR